MTFAGGSPALVKVGIGEFRRKMSSEAGGPQSCQGVTREDYQHVKEEQEGEEEAACVE